MRKAAAVAPAALLGKGARIHPDSRAPHGMLLVRTRSSEGSRGPWDHCKVLARIPGAGAFRPLSLSGCPLARGG